MPQFKKLIGIGISIGLLVVLAIVLISLLTPSPDKNGGPSFQAEVTPTATQSAEPTPVTLPSLEVALTATPEVSATRSKSLSSGILFESESQLYWQAMNEQNQPEGEATEVSIDLAAPSKIGRLYPSPDGKQILYFVITDGPEGGEGTWTLYLFSLPDGEPRQILSIADRIPVAKIFGWHPNGEQLIYGETDIRLLDINTGEHKLVAKPVEWAKLPYEPLIQSIAFSSDGQRLITSFSLSGREYDVWIANADGSKPIKLFTMSSPVSRMTWSPDGNSIAFSGNGLEVMNSDGTNRRTIGESIAGAPPLWSPDNHYLAFTALTYPEGSQIAEYQVRIADVINNIETNPVENMPGSEVLPIWSPDGTQILFLAGWSDKQGAAEIWKVNLDGTNLQQITSDSQPKRSAPAWLSNSGR